MFKLMNLEYCEKKFVSYNHKLEHKGIKLYFQYVAFQVASEHISRIVLLAKIHGTGDVHKSNQCSCKMCRNHVVLLENKFIEREIVKHDILVGTCLRNMLFKSWFSPGWCGSLA